MFQIGLLRAPGLVMGAGVTIQAFFQTLTTDLDGFILSAAIFALLWACLLYLFSGENERRIQQAKFWLYAAMVGLAVGLLAPTIAGLINTAAGGAGH